MMCETCGQPKIGMHMDDTLCCPCARKLWGDDWIKKSESARIMRTALVAMESNGGAR